MAEASGREGKDIQTAEVSEQQLFAVEDAASYARQKGAKGVTTHTIRELIYRGQVAATKIGKRLYVTKVSLDNFLGRSATRRRK